MAQLQSASRVVAALEFLATSGPARLDEIAGVLGVHKSNALRLLATLRQHGWIHVDNRTNEYSVGLRLISVGQAGIRELDIQTALTLGEELRDLTGESVHVCVPHGLTMLVVGRIDSHSGLKVTRPIGAADPMHTSAVGKAYLATLAPEPLEHLVSQFKFVPVTPNTVGSSEALKHEIEITRERKYAVNNEESTAGTMAIAVAIESNNAGRLFVSMTGPSRRFTMQIVTETAPAILEIVRPYQAL